MIELRDFLRVFSKLRPPKPKKNTICDPKVASDYIQQWGANEELCSEKLSSYLAILLEFVTDYHSQPILNKDVMNVGN